MSQISGEIHQIVPHPVSLGYGEKRRAQVWGHTNRSKGDCSNFNLLGKCNDPACTYNHKPAKVREDRQTAVARKIDQAMATMKGATQALPSTKEVSPA
jgi:hypothetical protein